MCSWCSSHILVHRMPLVLKMVSDKEYPRVHTNRQHVLSFICLAKVFFCKSLGYLAAVLVYGHKLDHGGFPVAAIIGNVHPSYTTDCHCIVSSCKVSATRCAKF